jgi:hypothetical protein
MKHPRRSRRHPWIPPSRRAKVATDRERVVADVSRDVLSVDAMKEFVERGRRAQEAVDKLTKEVK